MYGVVHGGYYEDLRHESAKFTDKYFPAVSIGGSYTSKQVLRNVLDWCVPYFQDDKPRHLLGIGEVEDLFEGVARGIDFLTASPRPGEEDMAICIYLPGMVDGRKTTLLSRSLMPNMRLIKTPSIRGVSV